MSLRSSLVLLAVLAGSLEACAQAEQDQDCVPAVCSASCGAAGGTCIDNRCICNRTDGGTDADADVAACVDDASCAASCRAGGWTGGACLGPICQCTGTPADADADAEAPDLPVPDDGGVDDAPRPDDATGEDAPADEVATEDATVHDVGDPCTVDDLVEQRICGAGMKCTFTELAGTRPDPFCDRAGERGVNNACAGFSRSDTCTPGHMCLNDGAGSRCRRLCRTDADCATLGTGARCEIQIGVGGTTVEGIQACTLSCSVVAGTGCDGTQACRPSFPDDGAAFTDCTGLGSGTQGADCSTNGASDCARRYQCFNLSTGGTQCLYLCELAYFGIDCPAPASSCNDIGDPTGVLGACL